MQNKPNFQDALMNVTSFYTVEYENIANWTIGQNKPNSNPIKPNFKKAQMNVNLTLTKDYRKKDDFAVRKNKPNSNPIFLRTKTNATLFNAKNYENETTFRPQKNKPKQTQFQTRRRFFSTRSPWDCLLHKRLPRRGVYTERSRRGPRNDIFGSFSEKRGEQEKPILEQFFPVLYCRKSRFNV